MSHTIVSTGTSSAWLINFGAFCSARQVSNEHLDPLFYPPISREDWFHEFIRFSEYAFLSVASKIYINTVILLLTIATLAKLLLKGPSWIAQPYAIQLFTYCIPLYIQGQYVATNWYDGHLFLTNNVNICHAMGQQPVTAIKVMFLFGQQLWWGWVIVSHWAFLQVWRSIVTCRINLK